MHYACLKKINHFEKNYCCHWFFVTQWVRGQYPIRSQEVQKPRLYRTKRKSPLRGSALLGKDRRGLSEMIPDPTPPEVKYYKEKNFQNTFRKAFLMRGRNLTTESYPRKRLPRKKDHSTKTRPSESSTLGHRMFDRGITDLNYSPPSREFTVATDLSCRSQNNCSRQVGSFIRWTQPVT